MSGDREARAVPVEQAPEARAERAQPVPLGRGGTGRWGAVRKRDVVMRLLRGEDLELVSREVRVTAAKLSAWRDDFLDAGQAGLKSREAPDIRDVEIRRLHAKIGELTMDNEVLQLLAEKAGPDPFARRSRR